MAIDTRHSSALTKLITGKTALGTNQATAFLLDATGRYEFTTVASGTGCTLDVMDLAVREPMIVTIANAGANPLTVYAPVGGTLNGSSSATIASGSQASYWAAAPLTWYSLQAGGAGGGGGGSGLTPTAVKTSAYTLVAGDYAAGDTTSGAFTFTFPTAPANNTVCAVEHVTQGSTNVITYVTGGSDTFNKVSGPTTLTLPYAGQLASYQYEASNGVWNLIAASSGTNDTGDYVASQVASTTVSLTNGVVATLTSISLPAGDWDVGGIVDFAMTAASPTTLAGGSSLTTATFGATDSLFFITSTMGSVSTPYSTPIPTVRYLLTTTTTIFLVARYQATAGTFTAGGTLRARRYR